MKIVILTEGGDGIGNGHVSRCSSLYHESIKRGYDVDFYIAGIFTSYNLLNGIRYILKKWDNESFLKDLITSKDFVIVDSYIVSKRILTLISQLAKNVLFIDDFNRLKYPKGLILIPSPLCHCKAIQINKDSRILCGNQFIILRNPFLSPFIERSFKQVKTVLITLGDRLNEYFFENLKKNLLNNYPNIQFNIIVQPNIEFIFKKNNILPNVIFHQNIDAYKMKDLMLGSDLSITAGGQTIYELIVTQTPFILIKTANNQENNIASLKKINKLMTYYHIDEPFFFRKLFLEFQLFINNSALLLKRIKPFYNLIDGLGPERIIDNLIINRSKIHLRKANEKDIKDVFYLSNSKYVRKYSLNKNKISWDNHRNWFNENLRDKNTIFYIVTNSEKKFLGQIRFQIHKDSSIISISLSKIIKGRGLAHEILFLSLCSIFKEKSKLHFIKAIINNENIASYKLFSKLNFVKINSSFNFISLILTRKDFYGY
jgi:spore coat polysaccharide biosynthesis predicted glycosyltransferase SpsG/RimJ/RimL family protein N-acetyltransferase